METANQQFLFSALIYLGFGEKLQDTLTKEMESGIPEFQLSFNGSFDLLPVSARLFFKRSLPETYYHFYKYSLQLEDKSHEFEVYKGWGVTLKEGYNLLCGRAVYKKWTSKKEEKGQAWIQLDLNKRENEGYAIQTWYDEYGFDLAAAVVSLRIELPSSNWDMAMLYRSLERGNLQAITIMEEGVARKRCMCANPKDKNILVLPDIKNPEFEEYALSDDVEQVLNKKKSKRARIPIK